MKDEEWSRRNHIAQEKGFASYWLFRTDGVGFVRLQWDHVYPHPHPDTDFYTDQDPYSYSDAHLYSYSYPYSYAPAHRVDSLAHQRYLGL
jgi:hypothetical protein